MPPRSLRWIRLSAGASWARADGATAAVAVAAAVVLMNARRLISYGAGITLPLELDDSRLVAASYHASWTGASRQSSPPSPRGLVIRASGRGINRTQSRFTAGSTAGQDFPDRPGCPRDGRHDHGYGLRARPADLAGGRGH